VAKVDDLFAEYRNPLYRYFVRAVGQQDAAQDLTQDVFARVSRTAVPSGSEVSIRAWLFRIARNLALDHHRYQQRRPVVTASALEQSRPAPQDIEFAVKEALAALPALDRDVFLMREVSGLGYEDIGKACELTPDAVRSRVHRARLHLREHLSSPISKRRIEPMRRKSQGIE